MKLLDDMKAAILLSDWSGVCKAYNKITGDNIQPPVKIEVFNYKTAKKRELYDWLVSRRIMDDYNKYTTSQLRDLAETFEALEMAECSIEEEENASEEPMESHNTDSPKYVQQNVVGSFYVSGQDVTASDKKLAETILSIPDSLQKKMGPDNPSKFTPQPSMRPKFEMVDATCLYCQSPCKARPENVSNITGTNSTTCEKCMATRRVQ